MRPGSASTKNRRSKRWTARNRSCRCGPAKSSGARMTMTGMARPPSSPRLTRRREVITQFHQRHRSVQFREFLDLIETQVPRDLDVHIIMDNYGTHKTPLIRNWFAKRPRFHVHFTPTYGSWLSLVERWFAELTKKQLRRGAYHSV